MNEPLRKRISFEEFDYQTLLDSLVEYAHPRDKITEQLRNGLIIRVKKGLYIFGDDYRQRPYSKELLANLIYGPSYISLEYALHHYGLIPERVEAITSVTTGRSRTFSTPVGIFTYRIIPLDAFRTGMDRIEVADGRSYLIAIPEKALADKLVIDRGIGVQTQKELYDYLAHDLRIDPSALQKLSADRLTEIAGHYRSRKVKLLADLIRRLGKSGKDTVHA